MSRLIWLGMAVLMGCGSESKPKALENCQQRTAAAKFHCTSNGQEVDFGPKAKEHNSAICALTKTTLEDNESGDKATDEARRNRCDFERMTILSRHQKMTANTRE